MPPRSEVILQDMLRFGASLKSVVAVSSGTLLQLPVPSATTNPQLTDPGAIGEVGPVNLCGYRGHPRRSAKLPSPAEDPEVELSRV